MLTLTNDAASAIRTLTDQAEAPANGLRISSAVAENGTAVFAVSLAPGPEAEDQVLEDEGAVVYVDSEVAPALDDKALHALTEPEGKIRFQLAEQAAG